MIRCATLIVFAAALLLAGCAAKTSNYLEEKRIILTPQLELPAENIPQLQEKATQTFLSALNRFHWEVRDLNKDNHTIVAEACRQGLHCAEIMATIMEDGSVSIIRTPEQVLSPNEGTMLKQWIGLLQSQYLKDMRFVQ